MSGSFRSEGSVSEREKGKRGGFSGTRGEGWDDGVRDGMEGGFDGR